MSLINLLRKNNRKLLFTTPSHGQKFFIFNKFRQFYKYDISETDCSNPQKALLKAEERAKNIYKTKYTRFLTNGSTSGIIASILSCTKKSDKVLIWDNAHPSHYNAVKLACCEPVYFTVDKTKEWGVSGITEPKIIEENLKNNNIKAVIITSPSYEGIVSDIKKIKEICSKYNAYLIVDEAHGALYPFCDKLPLSAINTADFTVQSLHKTAGGLNPTALVHSYCDFDPKVGLEMINTTSPSYPVLASIEANINYLNSRQGRKQIISLIENINNLKKSCKTCDFYGDDPLKILVKIKYLSGYELSEKLYKDFNIEDEKTNEISTMLLCGIGTSEKKIERLKRALIKICNNSVTL